MTVHIRLALCVTACLLAGVSAARAGQSTRIWFTIDVESNETFTLPEQVNAKCADGSPCGLGEISRLLSEHGWPATFFLNVYEQREWGEAAMRKIAVDLEASGHDVELHTHPQWAYDKARWAMHQYTGAEQKRIIRDGKESLERWIGKRVVAHRTGAYAANAQTLEALDENEVLLDSSAFWRHPDTRLDGLGLSKNLPSRRGRVLEIPVSVYERDDRAPLIGWLGPAVSVRKIDPNWFVDEREMKQAIDDLVAARVPVLVVFLHSFSLMQGRDAAGHPMSDVHARDLFSAMLSHLATTSLQVVTSRDLAKDEQSLKATTTDVVPRVTHPVTVPVYVWRMTKQFDRVRVGAIGLAVLTMGCALIVVRRRGRRP